MEAHGNISIVAVAPRAPAAGPAVPLGGWGHQQALGDPSDTRVSAELAAFIQANFALGKPRLLLKYMKDLGGAANVSPL